MGVVKTVIGDARDLCLVKMLLLEKEYDVVVNCIGLLNQFAEKDHEAAVFLNAYFPQYLAKVTKGRRTQVIHLSTDCVFSGSRGGYRETDVPDGELFYDRSKALGELIDDKNVTLRNSIIGPDMRRKGIGLVNWFLQQKTSVFGYRNAIWTGQTALQLAKTIESAAIQGASGLFHMVPDECISKFDMLILFNRYLRAKPIEVIPEENFRVNKSLVRRNYERFCYQIPPYEEQIRELGEWMRGHRELYPHYEL